MLLNEETNRTNARADFKKLKDRLKIVKWSSIVFYLVFVGANAICLFDISKTVTSKDHRSP